MIEAFVVAVVVVDWAVVDGFDSLIDALASATAPVGVVAVAENGNCYLTSLADVADNMEIVAAAAAASYAVVAAGVGLAGANLVDYCVIVLFGAATGGAAAVAGAQSF